MTKRALIFFLWLVSWVGAPAQHLTAGELIPPPGNGIADEGGVLGKNSGANRRIAELLQSLEREHGYRMLLVLHSSLITTTAADLAALLQQQWLPDGGGLVIVYESDTRQIGFGRGLEASGDGGPDDGGIASFSLVEILTTALREEAGEESPQAYIERLVTRIATDLDGYLKRQQEPIAGGLSLRLALVTIGALSLLALCGMGLGWLLGKANAKQSEVRTFPQLEIPERLGAPYGGSCGGSSFFGTQGNK